MKKFRLLALVLALLMVVPFVASCTDKKDDNTTTAADSKGPETGDTTSAGDKVKGDIDPADAVDHKDFTSVYDKIGSKVTIDMVTEDEEGLAWVTVDGVKYELGMDFLSMAMVYRTDVPANSEKYKTADDVYNEWWKLYIQRWNYLVPEIPLYSNQYFDLYNAKIEGLVTTPYWGPADAIVAAKVTTADNSVILGSATDLSGSFRNSSWGKSNPGSSDLDIQNLTTGYSTIMASKDGNYSWNEGVVDGTPASKVNEDGTLTFTIKIKKDLKFSDNSAINAKNYIAALLSNSTPVGAAAGGSGTAGQTVVGFAEFSAYDGTNDGKEVGDKNKVTATKFFKGVQLLDDYTFAVTYTSDYAGYYYSIVNAGFSPDPLPLYLGSEGAIVVDEATKACGLNDAFYAKVTENGAETYKVAGEIVANMKWNSALPYSGPYVVSNYDDNTHTATLKLNPVYPGDSFRGKASIATITYVKLVDETQMDMFKQGQVDVIAGITGGDATKAALKIVNDNPDKYKETHYDRAGYGKLGFRCDFGSTSFASVRRAIMLTINRNEFAQTFTGGYGSVVHGPYYEGSAAYKAVKDTIKLNVYTYSVQSAIDELVDGGWIYNEKGEKFDAAKDTVRYKKLSGYELSSDNLKFKSTDGKYSVIKLDGEYYMPLVVNWYGTQPNAVTDQLVTAWQTAKAAKDIGMYITYTSTEFNPGIYGELYRMEENGYDGTPKLNAINFATGFTSAVYDYAFNWTLNQNLYNDYNTAHLMDEADFYEKYTK